MALKAENAPFNRMKSVTIACKLILKYIENGATKIELYGERGEGCMEVSMIRPKTPEGYPGSPI